MLRVILTSAIVLGCFGDAHAEEKDENCLLSGINNTVGKNCISKSNLLGSLDLAAPNNSLFTLMGSTPETVITPKMGDSASFSYLPDAIDAFGKRNTSLAFEINPGLLMMQEYIAPEDLGLNTHSSETAKSGIFGSGLASPKNLSRFTVSLAYQQRDDDIRSSQLGLGINFTHDDRTPFLSASDQRRCVSQNASSQILGLDELNQFGRIVRSILGEYNDIPPSEYGTLTQAVLPAVRGKNKTRLDFSSALKSIKFNAPNSKGETSLDETTISALVPRFENALSAVSFKNAAEANKAIAECASFVTRWNRDVFGIGAAVLHTDLDESAATQNNISQNEETGFGIWASAAIEAPFGKKTTSLASGYQATSSDGQLIFSARYNNNLLRQRSIDDETMSEFVDLWSVGGRYIHQISASNDQSKQSSRAVRAFIEAAYTEEKFNNTTDEFWQAGIGAEFQIRKDLFFQFVIGDTFGSEIDRSTYLSGQFKWSFSKVGTE